MVLGLLKGVHKSGFVYNVICLGSTATFFLWFLEKSFFPLERWLVAAGYFSKASLIFLGNLPMFFEHQAHTSTRDPNTAPSNVN